MTDVDGMIEQNKNFLIVEWKRHTGPLPTGQAIAYGRMVRTGPYTLLRLVGDPKTMIVTHMAAWTRDTSEKQQALRQCNNGDVEVFLMKWDTWACQTDVARFPGETLPL
jgi:hypothetical protein